MNPNIISQQYHKLWHTSTPHKTNLLPYNDVYSSHLKTYVFPALMYLLPALFPIIHQPIVLIIAELPEVRQQLVHEANIPGSSRV